jgi:hypothetical protein
MNPLIAIWAHPRSRSTALERVMMERGDLHVVHEPFSEIYYRREQRAQPVGASFSRTEPPPRYGEIRDDLVEQASKRPVLFKDMCYHCLSHVLRDDDFLRRTRHVFLIRDPAMSIASHYAKNPNVTREEIGYEAQAVLFQKVRALSLSATVIDAEELVAAPQRFAEALFRALDLSNCPEALNWEAGHRAEWDSWKAWHVEAAVSSKMETGKTEYADTVHNNEMLTAYFDYHLPYYRQLHKERLPPKALK